MTKRATGSKTQRKNASVDPRPPESLSNEDRQALRRHAAKRGDKGRLLPKVKATEQGVSWDHPEPAIGSVELANVLETDDIRLADGIMSQLVNVSLRKGDVSPDDANFALSIVRGIAPRDPVEALLATQMAAIHLATMNAANHFKTTSMIPQYEIAGRLMYKLARTFTAQMDTLKRYRSTGEQSIRVQHVTVNDGGQAIVGDVMAGGGDARKSDGQPHEPSGNSRKTVEASAGTPMHGHVEAIKVALPLPGGERLEGVPVSRGKRRSAEREGQRRLAPRDGDQGHGGRAASVG